MTSVGDDLTQINLDTENENEIKRLKEQIKELEKIPKHGVKMKLHEIIEMNTKHEVPVATKQILETIEEFAKLAQKKQIKNKKINKRINECGNAMEPIFASTDDDIISLCKNNGYPDREWKDRAYIEIKLCGENQLDSALRSFYMSTYDKIKKSLPHILVAFIHIDGKLGSTKPVVKDIRDIELTLKCEWNTSNKFLYFKMPLINFTKKDIMSKSHKAIQSICKLFHIRANQKTDTMRNELIKMI